jgi:hypothetical protein
LGSYCILPLIQGSRSQVGLLIGGFMEFSIQSLAEEKDSACVFRSSSSQSNQVVEFYYVVIKLPWFHS